jgi:hypothetical protein
MYLCTSPLIDCNAIALDKQGCWRQLERLALTGPTASLKSRRATDCVRLRKWLAQALFQTFTESG